MTIEESVAKTSIFTASKSEFKGGIDKILGHQNKNLILIRTIIEGNDVTVTNTGNEIRITDDYNTGLGEMVLKGLNKLKYYCKNNQKDREIPEHIIRESFTDVTTTLVEKRQKAVLEAFKNENIEIVTPNGFAIKPRSENQNVYIRELKTACNKYVLGIGEAGTGKTFVAVAAAVEALESKMVDKIILTRPTVATENLGFLPGDAKAKMDPYMQPLYDALNDVAPLNKVDAWIANGTVEIAPLAFMRGRTLKNAYVIGDEVQNTNPEQMKMFLTRMGENCHVVLCGDTTQNDLNGKPSGLNDILCRLEQQPSDDIFKLIKFNEEDVVRSFMVQRVVSLYAQTKSEIELLAENGPKSVTFPQPKYG